MHNLSRKERHAFGRRIYTSILRIRQITLTMFLRKRKLVPATSVNKYISCSTLESTGTVIKCIVCNIIIVIWFNLQKALIYLQKTALLNLKWTVKIFLSLEKIYPIFEHCQHWQLQYNFLPAKETVENLIQSEINNNSW